MLGAELNSEIEKAADEPHAQRPKNEDKLLEQRKRDADSLGLGTYRLDWGGLQSFRFSSDVSKLLGLPISSVFTLRMAERCYELDVLFAQLGG
jgi:hypothetical protein